MGSARWCIVGRFQSGRGRFEVELGKGCSIPGQVGAGTDEVQVQQCYRILLRHSRRCRLRQRVLEMAPCRSRHHHCRRRRCRCGERRRGLGG